MTYAYAMLVAGTTLIFSAIKGVTILEVLSSVTTIQPNPNAPGNFKGSGAGPVTGEKVQGGPKGSDASSGKEVKRETGKIKKEILRKFPQLRFSSGWRSPQHNAEVGGVPDSLHTHGNRKNPGALDFVGPVSVMNQALEYARKKWQPAEAMVHDAGSGLHLHLGFF